MGLYTCSPLKFFKKTHGYILLRFTIYHKKSTIHVGKYHSFSMGILLGNNDNERIFLRRKVAGGAVFYGTFWCPACDAQRQLFGMPAWQSEPRLEGGGWEVPHMSKNGVNMHRFDINLNQMYWKIYIEYQVLFGDCGAHRKYRENQQRIIFGPSNSLLGVFFPLLGMWPLLFRCPFFSVVAY